MKRYHTLTQAHINHACQVIDHRLYVRNIRVPDRAFHNMVLLLLLRMGFHPKQVRNADDV